MPSQLKTKRVGSGQYHVEYLGRKFELKRSSSGGWNRPTFWVLKQEVAEGQGYHLQVGCETSKRDALRCLEDGIYAQQIV